jgi:glycine cleavage system H protein
MTERPKSYLYTKDHEWAKVESDIVTVGITDYAQSELGDVVFVDLPAIGASVSKGSSMFTVESVKAVSDIYSPFDGEIIEVNSSLPDSPQAVNETPFTDGWMVKIKTSSQANTELMDLDAYNNHVLSVSK